MPVTAGPNIVTDGLIFCVDPANKESWNGPISSNVKDLQSTVTGSMNDNSSGSYGDNTSFTFDGVDDWVNFGVIPQIDGLTAFTIFIYIKSDFSYSETKMIFGNRTTTSPVRGIGLEIGRITSQTSYFYLQENIGSGDIWVGPMYNSQFIVNGWNRIVITYNGSALTGRINDNALVSNTVTNRQIFSIEDFYLGCANEYVPNKDFEGEIGPLQIYNRCLSDSEIQQNNKAIDGRFGLS
jgi:hypothetical protein